LVYARDKAKWTPRRTERTSDLDAIYSRPDGDEIPWFDDNLTTPGAKSHQGMVYAVQSPFTGKTCTQPKAGIGSQNKPACWRR